MAPKNKVFRKKTHNIVKRLTLVWGKQVILFLISVFICDCLFWYSAIDLPSECIERGREKAVEAGDKTFPFLLSYGPYQITKRGNYLMILHYDVDSAGSIYQVYTDIGIEIMEEGELTPEHHYISTVVRKPNVPIQMLVRYGGQGNIKVYYVGVYPVWLIALAFLFMVGIIVYLIIRDKRTKYALLFIQGINTIFFIGTIYYADCTANMVKEKWYFAMLIFAGITIILSNIWTTIGKREFMLLSALAEFYFLEWRNIINFDYSFISLYLTVLISLVLLVLIYSFAKGEMIYLFLISVITTTFGLYSIVQYMYYCYFNDFFTLKVVRMLFTAMEATASIQELISAEVVFQLCFLLFYFVVLVTVYILIPRTNLYVRNRK